MTLSKVLMAVAVILTVVGVSQAQDLPDPTKTPGVAEPKLTMERICAPGFSTKPWRHVSTGDKNAVYRAYGMKNHEGACSGKEGCEVDHLIPLEVGGSNSHKNLWPQPFQGITWNAHVKDQLENDLHALVCQGQISLEEAQKCIASDWIACYKAQTGKNEP